jgi:hypothetical protein
MMDSAIIELMRQNIRGQIEEQNTRLDHQILEIKQNQNARGLLHSSNTIALIQRACSEATTNRGNFAWEIAQRCLNAGGIVYSSDLAREIKAEIDVFLPETMDGLQWRVREAANQAGLQNLSMLEPDEVHDARLAVRAHVFSEIDLFTLNLQREPKIAMGTQNTFNIHNSNVGAIQTGDQASTRVTQTITVQIRNELTAALEKVAAELDATAILPSVNKAEIIELIHDATQELKKEIVNQSKLKALVQTIGGGISGAVSVATNLKPAYESLKSIASACGFDWP